MPIAIRRITPEGEKNVSLAWLCDGEWSLPPQIKSLADWIDANVQELPRGEYVADVGFSWRRDAGGGGSALGPELLKKMGDTGFSLFLSEYAGFSDDEVDPEDLG